MRLAAMIAALTLLAGPDSTTRPPIAVAAVGKAPPEILAELSSVLRETFGAEVVLAPPLPLSESAYNRARGQYLASQVLDEIAKARRPEWDRLLGVTDEDLYVPDLNFVFGLADSQRAVAVFSLSRLRSGSHERKDLEEILRLRAATEAIHELGHTYALSHCRRTDCVMWFSNTLSESDRKGTRFCHAHAAELSKARAR